MTYNAVDLPEVWYIGGYGRSGSTLLDMMLGSHPQVFSCGEVDRFFQDWAGGMKCSCGQCYAECPFWMQVIEQLRAEFPDLNPLAVERLKCQVESTASRLQLMSVRQRREHRAEYGRIWQVTMRAISQVSDKKYLVDSSKSSRTNSRRFGALANLCGLEVKVIHLVRDPRAVIYSEAIRGSNDLLEGGFQRVRHFGGVYRPLIGWIMANISVRFFAQVHNNVPVLRTRYEDMLHEPLAFLSKLGDFLVVDMTPVADMLNRQRPLTPGHGVAGNRMRRQGPVILKADMEWITALPGIARLAALTSWPLARKYGYNVLSLPRAIDFKDTSERGQPETPVHL